MSPYIHLICVVHLPEIDRSIASNGVVWKRATGEL